MPTNTKKTKKVVSKKRLQSMTMNFAMLIFALIILGGYFGYTRYVDYMAAQNALAQGQITLSQLQADQETTSQIYNQARTDYEEQNANIMLAMEQVFPSTESYTDLAKKLDYYFSSNNTTDTPIFLSNLTFASPMKPEDYDYAILPLNMSITSNEPGLLAFLDYIYRSGDLNEQTRLMDIKSIGISFMKPAEGESQQELLNVNVSLNSYFRK